MYFFCRLYKNQVQTEDDVRDYHKEGMKFAQYCSNVAKCDVNSNVKRWNPYMHA
jgi:hypothetical protein